MIIRWTFIMLGSFLHEVIYIVSNFTRDRFSLKEKTVIIKKNYNYNEFSLGSDFSFGFFT